MMTEAMNLCLDTAHLRANDIRMVCLWRMVETMIAVDDFTTKTIAEAANGVRAELFRQGFQDADEILAAYCHYEKPDAREVVGKVMGRLLKLLDDCGIAKTDVRDIMINICNEESVP